GLMPRRAEQPAPSRGEVPEHAAQLRQRRALAFPRAPGAAYRGPGEPEDHGERRERRDDHHVAADDGASAEQRLLEAPVIDVEPHAVELARQLLEDGAGPRIGEEIAEEIITVHGEVAGRARLAGPV